MVRIVNMEVCDVYDEAGTRTGRTAVRGTNLPPCEYYLVVHVWIRNEDGEYLVQQRARDLDFDPGIWATTVGFVQAGEDSISGAIREASEELGVRLSPTQLEQFGRLRVGNHIEDLWLAEVSRNAMGIPKLGSEASDWKWAAKAALIMLASQSEFYPYSYLENLPD
jgi:8-oxo-dGTP diphosphatase